MFHIFAKYKNNNYYICSMSSETHIKNVFALYMNLYPQAVFELQSGLLTRLSFYKTKGCQNFVMDYRAKNFETEIIGG